MLSGESNAGERWKTTIGLISKKATFWFCTCSTLFLYISLSLFCATTTWNFRKLLSYTFFGGDVVGVLVQFFFSLPLIFTLHWWPLAFLVLSPPLQSFKLIFQQKNVSFVFFLSLALFLVELRFPAAYFLFFSVFLLFYIPNFWTWQLI